MKKSSNKKVIDAINEYNRQLCDYCGHSMIFMPKTEYLICTYCGKKVINKTKGHFFKKLYGVLNVSNRER